MLLRRLSGLVLALLTLHLNVLGADFACATHPADGHDMSQSGQMQDMSMQDMPVQTVSEHAMHGHEPDGVVAVAATEAPPPCELPVQPECCKALASCSVVFSAAAELAANDGVTALEARTPIVTSALPTERAAPEPPPPKA